MAAKQTDPKKKRLSAEDGISGGKVSTKMPSFKEIWSIKWTMLRCSSDWDCPWWSRTMRMRRRGAKCGSGPDGARRTS